MLARPARKSYAEATQSTATYPNNTPLLGRSAHATPPYTRQQQARKTTTVEATAAQRKRETQQKELVLLVQEGEVTAAEAINPLKQRNAINAALQTVSKSIAVVANVRLTMRKNLILTTTKDFTIDFLL